MVQEEQGTANHVIPEGPSFAWVGIVAPLPCWPMAHICIYVLRSRR